MKVLFIVVVSMAEEPYIPDFLKNNRKVIWWYIDNPKNVTPEFIYQTYTKLEELIKVLIDKDQVFGLKSGI